MSIKGLLEGRMAELKIAKKNAEESIEEIADLGIPLEKEAYGFEPLRRRIIRKINRLRRGTLGRVK